MFLGTAVPQALSSFFCFSAETYMLIYLATVPPEESGTGVLLKLTPVSGRFSSACRPSLPVLTAIELFVSSLTDLLPPCAPVSGSCLRMAPCLKSSMI